VSSRLLSLGHELDLLCLNDDFTPSFDLTSAVIHYGDINDEPGVKQFLESREYDVIVDWTVMKPDQARRDIRLFTGKTKQYIFISSASAYQKPVRNYLITEETPLINPYWQYSREKAECEQIFLEAYRQSGFPITIVRPTLTYGDTIVPYLMVDWGNPWSLFDRMKKGKRVIVPGDGTSLWVCTHNTDFAKAFTGLMGNLAAVGEAFHITSDEVLTWDEILRQIAEVLGVEANPVHISSEFIIGFMPEQLGNLLGDKAVSVVFDNSKIKRFVPDFQATVSFQEGIASTIRYFESRPDKQTTNPEFEAMIDRIIAAHDLGMAQAYKVD
jgi:nucleoside-diphosphate-sugar epimerase